VCCLVAWCCAAVYHVPAWLRLQRMRRHAAGFALQHAHNTSNAQHISAQHISNLLNAESLNGSCWLAGQATVQYSIHAHDNSIGRNGMHKQLCPVTANKGGSATCCTLYYRSTPHHMMSTHASAVRCC
jgi:hypothetical protein